MRLLLDRDRGDVTVKCPTGLRFTSNSPPYGAYLSSNARGMPGRGGGGVGLLGFDWYIILSANQIK